MILVLLGTQDRQFDRLINEVVKLKNNGIIKDKIIIQKGVSQFNDEKIESFDFAPKEKIEKLINDAKLIITHAGVGTITECISKNKKVIVVPRLKKYAEHTNDHQMQITKEFAYKNYILPVYDIKKLKDAIINIKDFKPGKYESNTNNFISMIRNFIDE